METVIDVYGKNIIGLKGGLDREAGVRGDLERVLQEKTGFWETEVTFFLHRAGK